MSTGHYEAMLDLYGIESGLRQARKHLGWYIDRHAPAASPELRRRVLTADASRPPCSTRSATRWPVAEPERRAA